MALTGLVYLPDPSFSAACETFARELIDQAGPRSVLRSDALAHITIAHVADVDKVEDAWSESSRALPRSIEVRTANLYFAYSAATYNGDGSPDPGVMAGIAVTSSALWQAEATCLGLDWVLDGTLFSANRDRFFPHITLGVMDEFPTKVDLQAPVLGSEGVHCRLAMGPIGEHGVFQRIDYI